MTAEDRAEIKERAKALKENGYSREFIAAHLCTSFISYDEIYALLAGGKVRDDENG